MNRTPRVVSCVAMIVVAGGCVTATFVPTQGAVYPSKDRHCSIEIFSSALPDREYEEIGIVEGEGTAWKSNLADILPELKGEGCAAGGDALIIESTSAFSEGREGTAVQRTIATVIRWKTG